MVEGAALVLDATDRLLGDLADAVPALRAVGDALALLADGLGVEKVIVAIDDPQLGRQVFCSGRAPLGEDAIGLWGPTGAWTEPPSQLDDTATMLLVRAVGVGVVRSSATLPARPVRSGTVAVEAAPGAELTRSTALVDAITAAAARAVRHGWGFTLVLAEGEPGLAQGLGAHRRAADSLIAVSDVGVALLLPETAGDRVPQVLARLASAGGVPPFRYGLACCPADGVDPAILSRVAAERLQAARNAAVDP
jgi:hypothetical protein